MRTYPFPPSMTAAPAGATGPAAGAALDLRAVAGEVVRALIRGDPALWARVQADARLWHEFGFDGEAASG
jgi:hypothetical protein